ncbi:MAG: cytochrome c3 family protein, partial [Planctomycetes bacterium]|nr:cytochrome c3 family protein [Planctomycetota bacterium]
PQAGFLRGIGGHGVPETPSLMGRIHMACDSCHLPDRPDEPAASCQHCHGRGTLSMVEGWKSWLNTAGEALTTDLKRVESALPAASDAQWAQSLTEARENLELVDRAGGAHNFVFAERLYAAAHDRLGRVVAGAEVSVDLQPFSSPRDGEGGDCRSCHVAAEPTKPVFGYPFVHETHVSKAGLGCSDCHGGDARHGALSIDAQFCTECHHQEEEDCARCHQDAAQMMRGDGLVGLADLPSPKNDQAPCIACHTDLSANADHVANSRTMCVECHEESYGPMQAEWLTEERTTLEDLGRLLTDLEIRMAEAASRTEEWTRTNEALRGARRRLVLLRRAGFVHNPDRARQIAKDIEAVGQDVARFLGDQP